MHAGRGLQTIAAELERQVATRKDYLAPQGQIEAVVPELAEDHGPVMLAGLNGGGPMGITPFAHGQLADHLGIPKRYYDRMAAEQPRLLADNVNAWLHAAPTAKRLVRTLDGKARAFLSDKFRPLDNYDLAQAILPVLHQHQVQVVSCDLTETRLYIKGILPSLSDAVPDGMQLGVGHESLVGGRTFGREGRLVAAIVISNSDIGAGTLRIEPSVFTTWCTNLAIMAEAAMKKYHVGRAWEADSSWEVFRDETRQADDRAFWLKVADVARAAFDPAIFQVAIDQIRHAAAMPIRSDNLPSVVEVATKRLALPERTQGGILAHLARGGDLTQWGLSSAITSLANTADEYEGATALERAGGQVLALAPSEWAVIADANGPVKPVVMRD